MLTAIQAGLNAALKKGSGDPFLPGLGTLLLQR